MSAGTAFLLGFGTCVLFWTSSVMLGPKLERSPTPEETVGLDPKLTPARFWIMRTTRFFFPSLISFWIDIRKQRQKDKKDGP
jgi:hypothetical protein